LNKPGFLFIFGQNQCMLPFTVTILGSSSALPTSQRFPTSQVVSLNNQPYLIDCGEGTQIQLRKYKARIGKLNHIFISHLHGDHIFGLPGLLSTLSLLGRKNDLHIYAHSPLQEILNCHTAFFRSEMDFRVVFHPLNFKRPQVIFENKKIKVESFPLKHRVPCCGFRFSEQPKLPHLRKDKLEEFDIPLRERVKIKEGSDFMLPDGRVIPNAELTLPAEKPRSYAFCTDTIYHEPALKSISGVDLLYHEATFANDLEDWAHKTYHSTAGEAATMAQQANARKLILGHFSARYNDIQPLVDDARSIFPESYPAEDGATFEIL